MIIRSQRDLTKLPPEDIEWALLDLQERGEVEVTDGRWVDRHGYRERMRKNVAHDQTVTVGIEAAERRARAWQH